jgi:transcriptional regulator with XRE-family HTH domain
MDTAIEKKLSKRIRELRKERGLTQERLAELAGVDYKHIQLLEGKNPSVPKLDTVEKIAKALKVSVKKLLDFK